MFAFVHYESCTLIPSYLYRYYIYIYCAFAHVHEVCLHSLLTHHIHVYLPLSVEFFSCLVGMCSRCQRAQFFCFCLMKARLHMDVCENFRGDSSRP